jgi:hypothetical protein
MREVGIQSAQVHAPVPDGITMVWSLLIVDFEDRTALDAWLKDEP